MNVRIYGTGCPKCKTLAANVAAALESARLTATVEKITDIDAIVERGVLTTPALEIDGEMVASGRLLSAEEIVRLIRPGTSATTSCTTCGKRPALRPIAAAVLILFALFGVAWPILRERQTATEIPAEATASENGTVVYYFHGTRRCMTCNKIEQLARAAVDARFKDDIAAGRLRFVSVNIEEAANEHFVRDFQLTSRTVVVAKNGKYERLDKVWQLVHDEPAFTQYVQDGVAALLEKESLP